MSLGKKLMSYRKHLKMSQEDVAEVLKVSRQTISNWELDLTLPDLEQAKKISKLYNISLDELINKNIKEAVNEKISNTEKLTGLIYKILKCAIALIIGFIILSIIGLILFITLRLGYKGNIKKEYTKLICNIKEEQYIYEMEYNTKNNRIISSGGDSFLIDELNLGDYEFANEIEIKIIDYVESFGGRCSKSKEG